jgi:hypothetical protein
MEYTLVAEDGHAKPVRWRDIPKTRRDRQRSRVSFEALAIAAGARPARLAGERRRVDASDTKSA